LADALRSYDQFPENDKLTNKLWIFNAKRAKTWEILTEMNVNHLKGYGILPGGLAEEIESDMAVLLKLNEKLFANSN